MYNVNRCINVKMNEYLIVLLSSLFCAHVCATTSSKYGFSLQLRNICISFGLDYNGIKKALENIRKSVCYYRFIHYHLCVVMIFI